MNFFIKDFFSKYDQIRSFLFWRFPGKLHFLYSAESANFYFLLLFLYLLFLVLSFHFDKILNSSKIFPYVPVKANIDKRIEDFLFAIFGKTTEF